jgi:hypothetical protein
VSKRYDLKFMRFNPHPGHVSFVPAFVVANPVEARLENVASRLSIRATAFSAYFDNLQQIRPFYEKLFNVSSIGYLQDVDTYQLSDSGLVRVFVGYDPVGTFLEWDTFADVPENAALNGYLQWQVAY